MTATPLSEAPLWRWSRAFYEHTGAEAWSKGLVPWRLPNSVPAAEAYAQLIAAWRADLVAAGVKTEREPVSILELGGGVGRLAFHLVRWLEAHDVPFRLMWTDAAQSNVDAFRSRPFVAARPGVVEALRLDVLGAAGALPRVPDVVLANYLFDSLPHDAWAVRAGQLLARHVRVELPPGDAPECERAVLHWEDVEASAPPFVRDYAARVSEGGFMIPTGTFECLERVTRWSAGRCLVLVADKGEPDVGAVQAGGAPKLLRQGGISAMVNFDALRAWWGPRPFFCSAHVEPDLGFYALAQGLTTLEATHAAWSATLGAQSLLHRLRELDALLQRPQPLKCLLETLAAWRFDPDVWVRMAEPLRSVRPSADECAAVVYAVERTWENHFEIGGAIDVAFELATVLHRVGQLTHAARFYERSLAAHGRHATVCFNLALCRLDLGDAASGAALLREVLELSPAHAGAARILSQLEAVEGR